MYGQGVKPKLHPFIFDMPCSSAVFVCTYSCACISVGRPCDQWSSGAQNMGPVISIFRSLPAGTEQVLLHGRRLEGSVCVEYVGPTKERQWPC